jgi:hypothetical protein
MSKTTGAVLAVVLVVVVFGVGSIMGFVGFQNDANGYENGIKAQYTNGLSII